MRYHLGFIRYNCCSCFAYNEYAVEPVSKVVYLLLNITKRNWLCCVETEKTGVFEGREKCDAVAEMISFS